MQFKLWLENKNPLPPIPEGCLRATHFTGPMAANAVLSGEAFRYKGMITSTTDSFSSNEEVWNLMVTGKTGAFSRSEFGLYVILLDMPYMEYKQHANPTMSNGGSVDNSRVLGVFDTQTQKIEANRNYNPQKPVEQLEKALTKMDRARMQRQQPQAGPPIPTSPPDTSNIDVW